MSKQGKAKFAQDYDPNPIFPICSNCVHFTCDKIPSAWNKDFIQEKNIRCGIGEFAVKKQGTCTLHSFKNQ